MKATGSIASFYVMRDTHDGPAGQSKTVLVVDDEMLICLDIQTQLDALGHRTLVAATSADAMRIIDTEPVELAIVDWHLGEQSAELLIDRLKQKHVPFVLCTGSTREELAAIFPDVPVVTKPYMYDQLFTAVEAAVRAD